MRVARFYQQCSRDNQMELQTTVVRLCLARTEKQVTHCWQTLDSSLDIGRPMSFDMFFFQTELVVAVFFV